MAAARRYAGSGLAASILVASTRVARTHQVSSGEEHVFRVVNNATDRVRVPVWTVMQSGSLAAVFVVAANQHRRGNRATAIAAVIVGVPVLGGLKALKPLIGRGRPERHLQDVSVRGKPQIGGTAIGVRCGRAAILNRPAARHPS